MTLAEIMAPVVLGSIALSAILTLVIRGLAFRQGIVDEPAGGRKIHKKRTALLGGFATGLTIIAVLVILIRFIPSGELRVDQLYGFMVAIAVLLLGGYIDDRYTIKPWQQFLFPLAAAITIVASGSGILQVTNPFGSEPLSMIWSQIVTPWITISLPADLLTILWLLLVTYAMKFLDGLDELVAGLTVVGGVLIASLAGTDAFFQPFIALLALAIAGAHLGFLPWNKEGSIFLGESGSTIAGFSLGVLAVISGAKVATAAIALAVPLVDIVIVIVMRFARGDSIFRGDKSHIHHRLLEAGLSSRMAVRMIWGIGLLFGLIALTLQTQGKIFLLAGLFLLIVLISIISYQRRKRHG